MELNKSYPPIVACINDKSVTKCSNIDQFKYRVKMNNQSMSRNRNSGKKKKSHNKIVIWDKNNCHLNPVHFGILTQIDKEIIFILISCFRWFTERGILWENGKSGGTLENL